MFRCIRFSPVEKKTLLGVFFFSFLLHLSSDVASTQSYTDLRDATALL